MSSDVSKLLSTASVAKLKTPCILSDIYHKNTLFLILIQHHDFCCILIFSHSHEFIVLPAVCGTLCVSFVPLTVWFYQAVLALISLFSCIVLALL